MQILGNNELIGKIKELHRIYSEDFNLLASAKEDVIGLHEKLNDIKGKMTYSILAATIIKPTAYNVIFEWLNNDIIQTVSDLMGSYNVPPIKHINDKVDKGSFIPYDTLLAIAESCMSGKTFQYYKNIQTVRIFKRSLNDLRGKSVYLHIPYKKELITDLIKIINIYINENEFSDIDNKIRYELLVNRKFSYPNFDIKFPKSGERYTITFKDRESAEKFYNFIMKS